MNKRIQKLFPKEFYAKDDLNLYAEISLKDLNTIINYIEKLENYGEAVGERRNQLYDRIEKAIDYINELTELSDGIYTNYCDALSREKLLKILGEKNE